MSSVVRTSVESIVAQELQEEGVRNQIRFTSMRAAGKDYWHVDGTKLFWLTELEAAERRAETSTVPSQS